MSLKFNIANIISEVVNSELFVCYEYLEWERHNTEVDIEIQTIDNMGL
jgi:hypothetical protein